MMRYPKLAANSHALIFLCTFVTLLVVALLYWNDSSSPIETIADDERRLESFEVEHVAPVLLPLSTRDAIAFGLATVGLMIAAGGGIGGGGLLVPIYILVLSFTPKQAIPLSNITVFGGAVANLLLNYSKRHPAANRPLVDWDLILIMEPLTLSGALLGSTLNVLMPDMIIVLSLVILLSLTGYKTFQKALKLHRQEVQGAWRAVKVQDETDVTESSSSDIEMPVVEISTVPSLQRSHSDSSLSLHNEDNNNNNQDSSHRHQRRSFSDGTFSLHESVVEPLAKNLQANLPQSKRPQSFDVVDVDDDDDDDDDGIALVELSTNKDSPISLREEILQAERNPRRQSIVVVASLFLFVLLVNILKGGGALQSPLGIQCGSSGFWILEGLIVLATIAVTLYARSYLLWQGRRKAKAQYQYLDTDIKWNEESTLLYPAMCSLAGMIAGLFGVGGGLVKAPLLLALGVHPAVASATSATMILFTTFTATTSFVAFGMLIWDYGLVCLLIGFCATLVGQLVMNSLLERTGKMSYIAFCIASVVLISAVTMTVEWGVALSQEAGGEHDRGQKSSGFCGQE